jgi:signal transduction histidine kinase
LPNQNQELHARVRRAAASVATLNEGFLRRIGAELHDGPAQDLSLALLRLDTVVGYCEAGQESLYGEPAAAQLRTIQSALEHALQEIRSIAAGTSLPYLGELSLAETVTHAVRAHERRTGTKVVLQSENLPEQSVLPIRITLYRLIQEALNNAYRHAGGVGQQVWVTVSAQQVQVEVSDQGPGFVVAPYDDANGHLGLLGMRERVESQGGRFQIESAPDHGTRVRAWLALPPAGESNE